MKIRITALAVVWVTCLGAAGCGEEPQPTPKFDATLMMANLAHNHFVPAVGQLDDDAKKLYGATQKWCAALGTADEAAKLSGAQAAWKKIMATWQRVELMKIGPLAASSGALRDDIYSWPTASACAVDQGVGKLKLEPNFPIQDMLVNWRGLDALEYLLFAPSLDTQCPDSAKPPLWDALSKIDKAKARCTYALLVAANAGGHIATFKHAWATDGGDYGSKLKIFGADGAFKTSKAAENAVSDALFYLESKTKDLKLGKPSGALLNDCGPVGTACSVASESRWAHQGKVHVLANLDAFEAIFTGTNAAGLKGDSFNQHLASVGQAKLSASILTYIADAKTAVAAIPQNVHDGVTIDRDAVVAAYNAVKKITDIMKTEFVLAVALDIPDEASGDND